MFKRFLLFTSGLLVVLSGPPSRTLAEGDHSLGARAGTPVMVATSIEGNLAHNAFDGNQEQ